jgi:hypothetical protein
MCLNFMDILHTSVRPRVKYLVVGSRRVCLGQVMMMYVCSLTAKPKLSEHLLILRRNGTSVYSLVTNGLGTILTAAPLH